MTTKMENKITSVEWLALQLYEKMEMKGSGSLFQDILEQAKAMHRDETVTFTADWIIQWKDNLGDDRKGISQFYNETYNK